MISVVLKILILGPFCVQKAAKNGDRTMFTLRNNSLEFSASRTTSYDQKCQLFD